MDGYERGERIAKGMVDTYFASKDYMDAYRAFRRAQKRGEEDEEKLFEAVARMRELAAHCVLYLRDNPEDKDGIEDIIDQILEDRGKEESK
jgi:hypothetical protein